MKKWLVMLGLVLGGFAAAQEGWMLGPFVKADAANPVLGPGEGRFFCPVRGEEVGFEEKDVFNPAAVVKDGKVWLLYRAEDKVGKYAGTSRIALAVSGDGLNFERVTGPVVYPDNDEFKKWEWEGGCEDPRIVETEDGRYVLTYSAYDGLISRLYVATSRDLVKWEKHGPAFGGRHREVWSKSGAIVCRRMGEKMVAERVGGKYWMYWGDADIYLASSDDLVNWDPVKRTRPGKVNPRAIDRAGLLPVLRTRPGKFDSALVEPGPPALITDQGILLLYNGANSGKRGDKRLADRTYAAGQALFDLADPAKVVARSEEWFLAPDKDYEIAGQVNNVCFIEGLVNFGGKWFLYYGTADSKIAVAVFDPEYQVK